MLGLASHTQFQFPRHFHFRQVKSYFISPESGLFTMPVLNITLLSSLTTPVLSHVASSSPHDAFTNPLNVSLATTPNTILSLPTSQTSIPDPSANTNSSWTIPVIIGVILALFAILVALPSAALAIGKLRKYPWVVNNVDAQEEANAKDITTKVPTTSSSQ
ncbi:hypothetical protein IQ06DRAFT_6621 [Phaeosphaeriaceae sp. SRC1lsM3a]|nr:hypothetical protein IQ06DRAFT_6621 [Stagonospora sp. SRC1lsM3a]